MSIARICRLLEDHPTRLLTGREVAAVTRQMAADDGHPARRATVDQLTVLADRFRLSAHEQRQGQLTIASLSFMNWVCAGSWSAHRIERIWANNPSIAARGALLRWATTNTPPWTNTLLTEVAAWILAAPEVWIGRTFGALHRAAMSRQASRMPPGVQPAFWRLLCVSIVDPADASTFIQDSLVSTLVPDFAPDHVSPAILGFFLRHEDPAIRQWAVESLAPVAGVPVVVPPAPAPSVAHTTRRATPRRVRSR